MRPLIVMLGVAALSSSVGSARADDPERVERVLGGRAEGEHDRRIATGIGMGVLAAGSIPGVIFLEDKSFKLMVGTVGAVCAISIPLTLVTRGPHEQILERHRKRLATMPAAEAAERTVDEWSDKAGTERSIRLVSGGITLGVGVVVTGLTAVLLASSDSPGPDHSTRGLGWVLLAGGGALTVGGAVTLAIPGPLERGYEEFRGGREARGPTLTATVPGLGISGQF